VHAFVIPADALSGGATFTNGEPAAVIVTVTSAELNGGGVTCVGNLVVGITSAVDFSYYVRFVMNNGSAGGGDAIMPPRTHGYIIQQSTGVIIAQHDLTDAMPTTASAATAAFTRVTARFSQAAVALNRTSVYWLAMCFTPAVPLVADRSTPSRTV
jgi:hypothetical protein